MSGQSQEEVDAERVCKALKRVLDEQNVTSYEVERLTGISNSAVRRMTRMQEPKPSEIAKIERALRVPTGTVLRLAGLVQVDSVVTLLSTDEALHPVLRQSMVESYRINQRLSQSD